MRVLAIDDEPEVLRQIEKAIAGADGIDGKPYDVIGLDDHEEALRRLDGERFDVVITDMVMGPDEAEGLEILRQLTDKSPVIIVLTAYPSTPNCVASIRAGAWDYIEKVPKDESDPYETLIKSIREACEFRLAHPLAGRSNPDAKWVHEHLGELMEKHPGEMVAVLDGKVVDHGRSYGELAERVKGAYPLAQPMMVSIPDATVETI